MSHDSRFGRYVESLKRYGRLDEQTERRLAEQWQATRDPRAARALVEAHLSFVVGVAYGFSGYGIPVAELVGEGNLGLVEALERFDPARNVRFVTYATWWIRANILEYVQRHWSIVRLPASPERTKLFFRLTRERAQVLSALGQAASSDEVDRLLSERFNVSAERIREVSESLEKRDLSLDAPVSSGASFTLFRLIADHTEPQDTDASRSERERIVRDALATIRAGFSSLERAIVHHRMLTDEPETLAEIGRRFGISRERVRQIEERLKQKLRLALSELAPERHAA